MKRRIVRNPNGTTKTYYGEEAEDFTPPANWAALCDASIADMLENGIEEPPKRIRATLIDKRKARG